MRTPKPAEESLSQVPRVTTKEIARRVEEPCSDRAGDVPQQPAADTKTTPPFQPRPIVFYLFPSVQNPSWTHRVGLVRDQLDNNGNATQALKERSIQAAYGSVHQKFTIPRRYNRCIVCQKSTRRINNNNNNVFGSLVRCMNQKKKKARKVRRHQQISYIRLNVVGFGVKGGHWRDVLPCHLDQTRVTYGPIKTHLPVLIQQISQHRKSYFSLI